MIDAVIFDLDGTLLDSNTLWEEVDRVFLANHGLTWDATYGRAVTEMDYERSAAFVVEHYGLRATAADIMAEWEALSFAGYRDWLPLKEGAREVLDCLRAQGVPMALVTLSPPRLYEAALGRLRVLDYFAVLQSVSKEIYGEKTPALYEDVCRRLAAGPVRWGFDDTLQALQAMDGAGLRATAIADIRNRDKAEAFQAAGFPLSDWSAVLKRLYQLF